MKAFLIPFLFLVPSFLQAQAIDSQAMVRQVDSLVQLSNELAGAQELDKALGIIEAAKSLAFRSLGVHHPAYASALSSHGKVLFFKGRYREAEPLYQEALSIQEKAIGKENSEYARYLHNLGVINAVLGRDSAAESFFLEVKDIRGRVLGKAHSDYAGSLNSLGNITKSKGNYPAAEQYFLEALDTYKKSKGEEYPDYSKTLNNLAGLYEMIGRYEASEQMHLKAKAIRERTIGKEHPDYAQTLSNLAKLYIHAGRYEDAEPLALEAVSIRQKVLGEQHPNYAGSLHTLAELYHDMGHFDLAEPLYLKAMDVIKKTLGAENSTYAWSLNNLANLYLSMGRLEDSEALMLEHKAIREKKLGKEHPEYCLSLINLGALYLEMGRLKDSEAVLLEAKAILDKLPDFQTHRFQAFVLNSLGTLNLITGHYDAAESSLLEANATLEKVFGKNHPEYGKTLDEIAHLYMKMERYSDASQFLQEAQSAQQLLLTRAARHLSELELTSYTRLFAHNLDRRLSYAQQLAGKPGLLPGICYDHALFQKGFLLTAASQLRSLTRSDTAAVKTASQLASFNRRLANEYARPMNERDSTSLANLEAKANAAEKLLARTVAGYGQAIRQIKWQDVQQKLKAGEAAVEFVHYRYYEKKPTDSTMYAALVLRPGIQQPVFISLFEEKQLDSLLQTQGERKADYVNSLYTIAERGAKPIGKPQKSLCELVWQPLEKEIADVQTIYFSPSGLLHRLNLGAVPISDEETLADRYRLVELGSTRHLVVGSPQLAVRSQDTLEGLRQALLFGGVQYEMDSTAIASANADISPETIASRGELNFSYADSNSRGGIWDYLKWTDKEVTAVASVLKNAGFKTTLRKGFTATETSFKSIGGSNASPRILHIATHGFFFPDPVSSPQSTVGSLQQEPIFKISDHPMIRSGLILAGGNYAWKTGKPLKPDMEDGILTAYEISQMNLSNTELVVLSACETGLGDIQGNEGVYGLQRAFKIAGAKYLVMSLWQVPDQETSVFMTTFYHHWVEGKMSIPDSFRTTQKEMRERFINPYQWAGFVLVE